MENQRVLYLSYDGLTDPLGQSQILPYLKGLSAKGHEIFIISFEKPDRLREHGTMTLQTCRSNNLHWTPLPYHKKPPVLSTLYDVWSLRRKAAAMHRKHNFSIVHCRSYITALVGSWLKKEFAIKLIFDMRGFWADERIEAGLWNYNNPLYRMIYAFFKRKEKIWLRNADHVVLLTENAKQEIETWGVTRSNVSVIPTCVDLQMFDPARIEARQIQNLKNQLNIADHHFVLLYLGSWGTWYLRKEMLDFFSSLKAKNSDAKFLIISQDNIELGDYPFRADVIHRAVIREEVPLYISVANAAIFFIFPTFSKKASSATKMGEILAMGVPVVTNKHWGDVAKYNGFLEGFYVVDSKYDSAIDSILNAGHVPQAIRKGAECNFSLNKGIDAYGMIYHEVMAIAKS
jgi:glycosyltransferase involved in cell wall biosynthesis